MPIPQTEKNRFFYDFFYFQGENDVFWGLGGYRVIFPNIPSLPSLINRPPGEITVLCGIVPRIVPEVFFAECGLIFPENRLPGQNLPSPIAGDGL